MDNLKETDPLPATRINEIKAQFIEEVKDELFTINPAFFKKKNYDADLDMSQI